MAACFMRLVESAAGGTADWLSFVKERRTAYRFFLPIWLAVLIFQMIVLNWTEDDAIGWSYPFVQIVILCVGLAAVCLAVIGGAASPNPREPPNSGLGSAST
ncbi:MAG: hypothetical protein H0V50_05900 [Thermoleophilaceae bacterium]|nr:hypothetical protein [Thermoleophilaceae bacterium]